MNNLNTAELLRAINFITIFKIGLVVALILYAIFAFFIIRQSLLMSEVLHTKFSGSFKAIAYLHLIASLVVLAITLILVS